MGCTGSKKATRTRPSDSKAGLQCNHANNEDIRDNYEFGEILGSGSFGQVREAYVKDAPDTAVRAVKMIERDNDNGEWSNQAIFVREVGLLQGLEHENIIRYYDFYEDPHFLYVVMEMCKGGEIFGKIIELKRFREKDAAVLGHQMLSAIQYVHAHHIAHRDIKAENFLLAEPDITSQVKMIDFGMACKFQENEVLTELCGSPHYLAPELIGQKYNHMADVWAFGVLLYLIMYGHYPYDAKNPRDIMVKILTEPIRWQTKVKLSNDALDLLKRLLHHDPNARISPAEAASHPWMRLATDKNTDEGEVIDSEILRSAREKVTDSKKVVDPKIDMERNKKFLKINEDFSKGIRIGQRLAPTNQQEYMSKPEFLRRDNKLTTAPSRNVLSRGKSLTKIKVRIQRGMSGIIGEELDGQEGDSATARQPKTARARAGTVAGGGGRNQRRLSYIGSLSSNEEQNLASLYASCASAVRNDEGMTGVLPAADGKGVTVSEVLDDDIIKTCRDPTEESVTAPRVVVIE